MDSDHRAFMVDDGSPPDRLDRVLARAWTDLSRSRLQGLIRDGHVRVEGRVVADPAMKVTGGAQVALDLPPAAPAEPRGEAMPLAVVYEDDDVIVIDKPAGLVVHPTAGHEGGTLVNALIAHCGESLSGVGGVKRPGIVHRLDKDTSGLLVVAKNDRAHRSLAEQFADHGRSGPLERVYLTLAWGAPEPRRGSIEADLGRSPHHREKMAVVPRGRGRHAVTYYEVDELFGSRSEPLASSLRCRLETGRTHQIRVHLAHIGHPLLGDSVYGAGFRTKANRLDETGRQALADLGRQALHAAVLGFAHPSTGRHLRFDCPPPADFNAMVLALRAQACP